MRNRVISILLAAVMVCFVAVISPNAPAAADPESALHDLEARLNEMSGRIDALTERVAALEGIETIDIQVDEVPGAWIDIDGDTVLAELGDTVITYQQVYDSLIDTSFGLDDIFDLNDQGVLNSLLLQELHMIVERMVLEKMAADMGIELNEEEIAEVADEQYMEFFEYYFEDFVDSGMSEEEAKAQADDLLRQFGMNLDALLDSVAFEFLQEAVRDEIAEPLLEQRTSEEGLREAFELYVEESKIRYAAEAEEFEFDMYFFDAPVYYIPEGYRAIKHLFLAFDDEMAMRAEEILDALDALTEEDEGLRPGLNAMLNDLKEPFADQIATIEKAIQDGADFDALIAQYGEDPGMEEPDFAQTGYYISEASEFWFKEFQETAFALNAPGDISGPVVSGAGIHFIKYVADVSSGPVPFESVKDAMVFEIGQDVAEEALQAAFDEWGEKLNLRIFDHLLPTGIEEE